MNKKNISIIMATKIEATPFISGLNLVLAEDKPFRIFKKDNITLVITGIGKINSAVATGYVIEKFTPEVILNLGAAGTAKKGYYAGEILQIESAIEYDKPNFVSNKHRIFNPSLLEGFKSAVIATQDKPVLDSDKREEISIVADLIDMEGAAVVYTANLFNVKCYLFKFVSDTLDDTEHNDIIGNIKKYRLDFYNYISDKVLSIL